MNDCRLQDLYTPYQQVIHSRILVKYIFFLAGGILFPPPSYNPSKFYIPVNIFSPCSKAQPLDALETPYFEPKKKAVATN